MAHDVYSLWTRLFHPTRRRAASQHRPLTIERLEDRTLLNGDTLATAALLPFTAFDTAHAAGFLNPSAAVNLFRVVLNAGDQVSAAVSTGAVGSGLQSLLRVFDANGKQVALDDQEGGDPSLTFQATTAESYYVGVSSAPDDNYDPTLAGSGKAGTASGLYSLDLRLTPGAPFRPTWRAVPSGWALLRPCRERWSRCLSLWRTAARRTLATSRYRCC